MCKSANHRRTGAAKLESCPSSRTSRRGAAELVAEETTLRELGKAQQLT